MQNFSRASGWLVAALVAPAALAQGQTYPEEAKLTATVRAGADYFGADVAISGDTLVVGAPGDDTGASRAGAAYVFARDASGWSLQAELRLTTPARDDQFGSAVAIAGDTILVGAPEDAATGTVTVFTRAGTSWTERATLVPASGLDGDYFGISVALDGTRALIGARWSDEAGPASGSAYVFSGSGSRWVEEAKLVAPSAVGGDYFGESVDLLGDRAIVGAPGYGGAGAAHVYERGGGVWAHVATLVDPAASGAFLGAAVSLGPDLALVGAPRDNTRGTNAGAAHVFTPGGGSWSLATTLFGGTGQFLGEAVTARGDLLVGAPGASGGGWVNVYGASTWTFATRLRASDRASGDRFGDALASTTDGVVVGAWGDTSPATNAGAAYAFEVLEDVGAPCRGSDACASGFCVDGVCCESACGGGAPDDCLGCAAALSGLADGTCGPRPRGAACGQSDTSACSAADTCDGAGLCQDNDARDGTPCVAGTYCAAGDTCVGGTCIEGSTSPCGGGLKCVESTMSCVDPCGDGELDPGEQCDDGPSNSDSTPDACRTTCLLPYCGDAVVDDGEMCDSSPGCAETCVPEEADAGVDGGTSDGGTSDGGTSDGGVSDADGGVTDGGAPSPGDAGSAQDGGASDAAVPDGGGGPMDAGVVDPDGGPHDGATDDGATSGGSGCSCGASPGPAAPPVASVVGLVLLALRRKRRRAT